jgi:glycosyltransferase involved in cell wall biosynthesis
MKITFLMPCYPWSPMGGFKVVYEYCNELVERGHQVTVVHARQVKFATGKASSLYEKLRNLRMGVSIGNQKPIINWQRIDPRVNLLFVPDTSEQHIPAGDVIFATAWNTAPFVLKYGPSKGSKFYLIQHYETWLGPKEVVDETWRSPLNKIVVSRWLLKIGRDLGALNLEYVPNAVDHDHYRVLKPVENRPKQIAMLFSHVPLKGARDGVEALEIAKDQHPELKAILFGTGRHANWIPKWAQYHREPAQDFIVREIYNKASIFLSSSWAEGFALPPAEAACCGCAVVATDSGGIADFIENDQTGLLSAPKDPQALGVNLCRLLENEGLRLRLAENARQRLSTFTWKKSAEMMESVIESSRKMVRDLQAV